MKSDVLENLNITKEKYPNATGSGDTGSNNDGLRGEVGSERGAWGFEQPNSEQVKLGSDLY